jgi:hypothetical protein
MLSVGAMQSIWAEQGLINGNMGVIHSAIWPASANVYNELPRALSVEFDNNTGLLFLLTG